MEGGKSAPKVGYEEVTGYPMVSYVPLCKLTQLCAQLCLKNISKPNAYEDMKVVNKYSGNFSYPKVGPIFKATFGRSNIQPK